jgi:hypothetical protein
MKDFVIWCFFIVLYANKVQYILKEYHALMEW